MRLKIGLDVGEIANINQFTPEIFGTLKGKGLTKPEIEAFQMGMDKSAHLSQLHTHYTPEHNNNFIKDAESFVVVRIKQQLLKCKIYVGVTAEVDVITVEKMVRMIIEYYSEFTLAEIEKAFDLAMLEKFDTGDGRRLVDSYGVFSVAYVTAILNRYRIYRSKIMLKAQGVLNEKQEEERRKAKGVNRHEFLQGMIDEFYKLIETGFEVSPWYYRTWFMYYDYLSESKLISLGAMTVTLCENDAKAALTAEQKADALKQFGKKRGELLSIAAAFSNGDFMGYERQLSNYVKTHQVIAQVKAWHEQGVDFVELIEIAEGYKS